MPPAKSNKVITLPSAESNVRVWRKRRMRNATGDDAYSRSAAKVIERAQKALLRGADRVDDGVSQEPSLSVPPPYSQSLTDLQIQDEEVSRSLIFRPFVDQKSGAWVFDGVDKGQEGQWLSHLSGPIPQPSEDQVGPIAPRACQNAHIEILRITGCRWLKCTCGRCAQIRTRPFHRLWVCLSDGPHRHGPRASSCLNKRRPGE